MKPLVRLGAESPFGLALPSGTPTASQLYAPRGIWCDGQRLVVADSGNHRVLIWHTIPTHNGAPADVVLGQADFVSEGAARRGSAVGNGMHLPTGVLVHNNILLVADAWHHRVLVWRSVPTVSDTPPDLAIGQPALTAVEPNRGGPVTADTLYWPYGLGVARGMFWIADTGNRRVLGWPTVPLHGEAATVVIGQPDFGSNAENRGGAVSADSFRWPHAIAGSDDVLYIADAGNHRVLGYADASLAHPTLLLGQKDFESNEELPHRKQGGHRFRFPYAVTTGASQLLIADTANNRVLIWDGVLEHGIQPHADVVLGQTDFDAAGENRWKSVTNDSLCWPYGICAFDSRLAIADSGNNRVVIWSLAQDTEDTMASARAHHLSALT
jgi:hypothetical protein